MDNRGEALTLVIGPDGYTVVAMHSDVGDLINYGVALASLLGHTIVIDPSQPVDHNNTAVFHGIGYLAASVVAHFHFKKPGQHHLLSPTQAARKSYEYVYRVWNAGVVRLDVRHDDEIIFDGEPHEFVDQRQPIAAL